MSLIKNQPDTNKIRDTEFGVIPDDLALLNELREAWRISPGAPIVVVGQLNSRVVASGKTLYFLDEAGGVFRPGQFFFEGVEPESIVDALA